MRKIIFAFVFLLVAVALTSTWFLATPGLTGEVVIESSVAESSLVSVELPAAPIAGPASIALVEVGTRSWISAVSALTGFDYPVTASVFWSTAAIFAVFWIRRSSSTVQHDSDPADTARTGRSRARELNSTDRFAVLTGHGDGGIQSAGSPA